MLVLPYSKLLVRAGCRAHNVHIRQIAQVVSVENRGAEYGHTVRLVVKIAGFTHTYEVRHANRLRDSSFNAHKGNPLERVRFSPMPGKSSNGSERPG